MTYFTYIVCFPFRGSWQHQYQALLMSYLPFGYLMVSFVIFSVSVDGIQGMHYGQKIYSACG